MNEDHHQKGLPAGAHAPDPRPHRIRLPGFVVGEPIGLGDVIKTASSYIGLRPCGGCENRAAALNRWLTFSGPNGPTGRHK
jgi:hypothetical protein